MSNRRIAASGFLWNILQTVGERFFQTVVFFFVARLLQPTAFGLAAMAVVPAAVFGAVMTGASQVIVREKDLTHTFETAALWFNVALGCILGLVIFFAANPISDLVRAPTVAPLMMATSCVPLLSGLGAVSQGIMNRRFEFRKLAIRRTIGITLAGLSCVVLAVLGFGAWSLVVQAILTAAIMSAVGLFAEPVRIFERISKKELVHVARQASILCSSNALLAANVRLIDLIVGYFAGPAAAGAFRLGRTIVDLILSFTLTPAANVLLPIFANASDEPERGINMYVKIVVACSLVFSVVEICVIFGAESFSAVFLGSSWPTLAWVLIFLAPLFPTMCMSTSQPLLIARQRSGMVLWANAIRLVASAACVALGSHLLGVNGAAIGYTVCSYLAMLTMITFMRYEIPTLRNKIGFRILVPQMLALIVGLGGYSVALRLGINPKNIAVSVVALSVALVMYLILCLIFCRSEIGVTLDMMPLPERIKRKISKYSGLKLNRPSLTGN